MIYALGALGFLLALLLSVTLHEAGHFLTARRYGMKATQFFVGFGPTLFSRRRGETEYGVKAIPAGGFVKIVGMTPLEDLEPGDEDRAFYKQPVRRKVVVLAAGSTVHFLIAVLLVVGATFAIGTTVERNPTVGAVAACVVPTVEDECGPDSPVSPAKAAGLQAGDRILSVDGRETDDRLGFIKAVRGAPGRSVPVVVERDGRVMTFSLTPQEVVRPSLDAEDETVRVGAIGVTPRGTVATERQGFTESLSASAGVMRDFLVGIKITFTEKLGSITRIYSDKRDPEGFIGVVGAGRISGEVLASTETAGVKALSFILIIASLNLFVGVFNLLPLLPLDGGHIAVAVFEGARDKLRRLRGYTGAFQRVDYTKLMPLTYGVAGTFLIFTVLLLGADIVNPIRIT